MIVKKKVKKGTQYVSSLTLRPYSTCSDCSEHTEGNGLLSINVLSESPIIDTIEDAGRRLTIFTESGSSTYYNILTDYVEIVEESINCTTYTGKAGSIIDMQDTSKTLALPPHGEFYVDLMGTFIGRSSCPNCGSDDIDYPSLSVHHAGGETFSREGYVSNNEIGMNIDDFSVLMTYIPDDSDNHKTFPAIPYAAGVQAFIQGHHD